MKSLSSQIRTKAHLEQSHENGFCPYTKEEAINVYTDHSKANIDEEGDEFVVFFNACGLCGENKTIAERLEELAINRGYKEES